MSISHELEGRRISFVLPVTLSPVARRGVLISTGVEPMAEQIFVVDDLTDLAPDLRSRMVDTWDKINVQVEEEIIDSADGSSWTRITGARNERYLDLYLRDSGRWARHGLADDTIDVVDVAAVFYATPGRTVDVVEYLSTSLDTDQKAVLDAMLAGSPLVSELGDGHTLSAADALDAYERALELAPRLIDLVDLGTRDANYFFHGAVEVADEAIFLYPDVDNDRSKRVAALLKQADPQAYAQARELLDKLKPIPHQIVAGHIDQACRRWWTVFFDETDQWKVDHLLKTAVSNAVKEGRADRDKQAATERYEECRAKWIAKHGSLRLQRAAARGYRHDGIYRDERLDLELPGFVGSLGRKPTIRELVNPSEFALELEARALARAEALGIPEDNVRLVYARPGQESAWDDGAFVQIEGYLGRHAVWQSVSGERSVEDILS